MNQDNNQLSARAGVPITHTLVLGNLLSNDQSTLYLDASSGFDATLPITVVAVVATRLGSDIAFKEMGPSALLSNFSVTSKAIGDAPFTLTAPVTNSAGAFTYTSSNPAVATVSGSTVTIVGGGTTTITATQAATATYASNSIPATFTVLSLPTLSNFSITTRGVGNAPFTLTSPVSNSAGAFIYTSSNPAVATVSGSTVTIVAIGTTTITAIQAVTATYASNSITSTFTVLLSPTLSNFSVPSKIPGDAPFALTAPTSNSDGAFTYSSSNPAVATVTGSTVTIVDGGTTTITATQAVTATYVSNSITATFTVTLTPWVQRGQDIGGEAASDYSGYSVSISSDGNVVAIGADGNDGNGSDAGHVRVYEWNGTAWVQRGQDIDGEAAYDRSGFSVSISSNGNVVAIGAYGNDGNGSAAGHVRVYEWNGTAWVQRGEDIDGEAVDDRSGTSVSISLDGNVVAIGAPYNDGNGSDAGHVRVYAWNGTAWVQRGEDIDGEAASDESGTSVSISSDGNVVAIGAYLNDGNGSSAGHVRVYEWNGTAWVKRGQDIDGEAAYDYSGLSVSISSDGNVVAIGSTNNDGNGTNAGHVRVYAWNGTAWVKRGQDIDGEAASDGSGRVSISSDGNVVAIGAASNDGKGTDAGHVRVYAWNGTTWLKRGQEIDGEAADDYSGSVSISSDGNVVAIGANYNDGNGSNAGHVRVYYF